MTSDSFFNVSSIQKPNSRGTDSLEKPKDPSKNETFSVWYAPNGQNSLQPQPQVQLSENTSGIDKTNQENTSLKKKKIEMIQDDRHKMRLQVRQENGQNIDKSF